MAEWFKAAVLKTVVRKYRGFESYSLRHNLKTLIFLFLVCNLLIHYLFIFIYELGEVAELA